VSKAFTKEDDDIPEREGRMRTSSGLPPGAVNYMTENGAQLLREKLARARGGNALEIRRVLDSATVVPAPETPPREVLFGGTVTICTESGDETSYHIAGVDEEGLFPGWVSWVSPLARALIGMRVGRRVSLPGARSGETVMIVAIE
jgi:transcription elongation factor GreB